MATGSQLILVMAQSVRIVLRFLVWHIFGENCMKKNFRLKGRTALATVNCSFEHKFRVRYCNQSAQPLGCSFLSVLDGP